MIFAFMSNFMFFTILRKSGKYEKSFGMDGEIKRDGICTN